MKILVTGGAGFIGSHLTDFLVNEGHDLVVIDNLSLGRTENIAHLIKNNKIKFYKEDLLNYSKILEIFNDEHFEIVFHLAANSDIAQSRVNPEIDLNNTFITSFNVLNIMRICNVKKIFFSSTSAIYGNATGKLTEDFGPLLPVSNYGAGKLAAEGFISSFVGNYDMQAWIVRFPNVVGERATHGVVFDFINKLKSNPDELVVLGDGEQYKPYFYVKDLIEAMLFIWKRSNDRRNIFNIGVDSRTKVKDIAKMVIEEMGLKAKIKYTGNSVGWIGDVAEFNYDLTKLSSLGWKAKITSDEAVRKSIICILGKYK